MPAYTVSQLEPLLGQYVEPDGQFTPALAQVLPRIYAMGLWRDLVFETSLPAADGYISLPADAEAVLACTINDLPRSVRSMWHDVRIVGRHAQLSAYFGIVDDGFYPIITEMKDLQSVDTEDDVTPITAVWAFESGQSIATLFAGFVGEIKIRTDRVDGGTQYLTATDAANDLIYVGDPFTRVLEVTYTGITNPVSLVAEADISKPIAEIPVGSGVARYRRFRVSDTGDDTTVHLLVKRACPSELTEDTIVHLGNINAIKHGLLGRIAEDNADIDRAQYHWTLVQQLLDSELDAFRGAAKPAVNIDVWGGNRPYNIY